MSGGLYFHVMSRVTLPHTRFTVDKFVRLVEADAFGTTRVELLNGRMHFFGPQSGRHMAAVSKGAETVFAAPRREDSGSKLRKYAYHGIPDCWIENLRADRVEVYRDPVNPTGREGDYFYASVEPVGRGQSVPVLARPGVSIGVDDLLP